MGDWRITPERLELMQDNKKWNVLSEHAKKLVTASSNYYDAGVFPPASLVDLERMPSLVTGIIVGGGRL